MTKKTVATLTAELATLTTKVNVMESVLINNQLATTKTLGRQQYNHDWLVEIGINEEALVTDFGKELVEALQICEEGNWYKLRFISSFYKANNKHCKALLERVGNLSREKNRGSKQTKRNDKNPVTWLLVAKYESEKPLQDSNNEDEPTF